MKPPASLPSRPLHRLALAGLCVVLAVAFVALGLGTAATVAAVCALGCVIASALAVGRNGLRGLVKRFPQQMKRAHVAAGYLVMLGTGALAIWWALAGMVSGIAPTISRHAGTVGKAEDPLYFWVSVAFHLALGVVLLGGAVYVARRRRTHAP
jgi:hypothetical protein